MRLPASTAWAAAARCAPTASSCARSRSSAGFTVCVRHGHVEVDGRRVNIPSFRVAPGMEIGIREKSVKNVHITEAVEFAQGRGIPPWLELDAGTLKGKVVENPTREDIRFPIQEQLIVELYSR